MFAFVRFLKFIVRRCIDNVLYSRCCFINGVRWISLLLLLLPFYPAQHCISIHSGARSTVGALKPDRDFNVHKLLISSFISRPWGFMGHSVRSTVVCPAYLSAHHIVTAASCHWGNVEEDPHNKTCRPWSVTHVTQTNTLSLFIACMCKDSRVSSGKIQTGLQIYVYVDLLLPLTSIQSHHTRFNGY